MERRDRSLIALKELIYLDSLDSYERADALVSWNKKHIPDGDVSHFDLERKDLELLLELFYRNIKFLKNHKEKVRHEMVENRKLRKFLQH